MIKAYASGSSGPGRGYFQTGLADRTRGGMTERRAINDMSRRTGVSAAQIRQMLRGGR